MEITYFVHSTTLDNETGIVTGWDDSKLSLKGKKQAEELRSILDSRFDIVLSSDLGRAVETASIAFSPLLLDTDWRLREVNYGTLNKKPSGIVKQNLAQYVASPFPEGESYEDVAKRVSHFLDEIKLKHEGKRVALVAHQAPQLALDVLLYKKTWEQAFQDDWRNTGSWRPGWVHKY